MSAAVVTERDFDLIEVALEAAAGAVQNGADLRALRSPARRRKLDPLAEEYLIALEHITKLRQEVHP